MTETDLPIFGPEHIIQECIGEAIGLASMCWSEPPSGVFDSDLAAKILRDTMANIEAYTLQASVLTARSIGAAVGSAIGRNRVMTPPRHQDGPGYEDKPTINRQPKTLYDQPPAPKHPEGSCVDNSCGDLSSAQYHEIHNYAAPEEKAVHPMQKCGNCGVHFDTEQNNTRCPHRPITKPIPVKDNPQA